MGIMEFTGNGKHATIPGPFANAIPRMAKGMTTAGNIRSFENVILLQRRLSFFRKDFFSKKGPIWHDLRRIVLRLCAHTVLGIDHTTTTSMMRYAVLLVACVALAHAHGPPLSPLPFSCSAALVQMEQRAHDNLELAASHHPITRLRGGSGLVASPPQESPSKVAPAEPQRVFHFGKKGTDGDKVCDSTCLL